LRFTVGHYLKPLPCKDTISCMSNIVMLITRNFQIGSITKQMPAYIQFFHIRNSFTKIALKPLIISNLTDLPVSQTISWTWVRIPHSPYNPNTKKKDRPYGQSLIFRGWTDTQNRINLREMECARPR